MIILSFWFWRLRVLMRGLRLDCPSGVVGGIFWGWWGGFTSFPPANSFIYLKRKFYILTCSLKVIISVLSEVKMKNGVWPL